MSTSYQIYNQQDLYFLTVTTVDWVDVFTRPVYKNIIIDSLRYCISNKGLEVYGYVIMTNHLHLIVRNPTDFGLSATIRDFKKFTAKSIIETVNKEPESRREWLLHRFLWNAAQHERNSIHQVWQQHNHAVEIRSRQFFDQRLNYIHQNPVRAEIVAAPEDYIYSSAYELSGRGSTLPILEWN
jgi:REP element-mobilizing transposase RayT